MQINQRDRDRERERGGGTECVGIESSGIWAKTMENTRRPGTHNNN